MTRPLVTMVTPSYNQGRYLEEAIRSVLEQDYQPIEYTIVDGGSTDGSVETIRRYADRLAWWTSEPDRGQAHALNKAFARASGKYLGWLCADDTLLPNAISRLVDALEPDPEFVIAYGDAIYTDEHSERKHTGHSGPWDPERMVREAQVPNKQPASLYTRRGWELAGPLDEDAWYYLDFQLTVRLAGLGRGVHVPEPLATYRIHAEGKSTGAPARKAADAVRCAQRFMRSDEVPPALRPLARREGRASLYRIAGANYYAALKLGHARSAYLRALVLAPRRVLLRRVAKCFLPRPVVRRLRERRVARIAMEAHGTARG